MPLRPLSLFLSALMASGATANQCQSTKPPYRTNVGDACTGSGFASTCCAPGEGDAPLFKCGPQHTCCDTGENGQIIDLPTTGQGACIGGKSTLCCSGQCERKLRPGNHPTFFYSCKSDSAVMIESALRLALASTQEKDEEEAPEPGFVNITTGAVVPGVGGGGGGGTSCSRGGSSAVDCGVDPRQLVGARDFALGPNGRHLYVATTGYESIGEYDDDHTAVHDNSSRLVAFDLGDPTAAPVTLSYCGPWVAVEFDAKRGQVVALRHANLKDDEHGTHYAAEVVAFDVNRARPARDAHTKQCYNSVPNPSPQDSCGCAMGLDPDTLNGRVIGRNGIKKDGILPAATMTLQGDNVLVGDQNQFCVLAFPLDGSAGKTIPGKPVAGTCGKSCGAQGCASIGFPSVPAGKKLGDGDYGAGGLVYKMFKAPGDELLLQDMNTETVDYGKAPKAQTKFTTVPVQPRGSSLYFAPVIDPASGDLLLVEKFSLSGQVLTRNKADGFGRGKVVLPKKGLEGWYLEASAGGPVMTPVQGVVVQWAFAPEQAHSEAGKRKVIALVSLAYSGGGAPLDYVFLELIL